MTPDPGNPTVLRCTARFYELDALRAALSARSLALDERDGELLVVLAASDAELWAVLEACQRYAGTGP